MKLAETKYDYSETGCCARLEVDAWDRKEFTWEDKPFLQDRVTSFLHIPLNMGAVMKRAHGAIEGAAAYPEEPITLSDECSPWHSDVYLAVEGDVPEVSIKRISGTFITKVFEGPYRNAGKWMKEMAEYVSAAGRESKKVYLFYSACPRCAKHFGKNYVVLFARVA